MSTNTHATFLKEMGITQWTSRDAVSASLGEPTQSFDSEEGAASVDTQLADDNRAPLGKWWFIGAKPQGDAEQLFQNIIRVLGLGAQEWSWVSPNENIDPLHLLEASIPMVALAFGGSVAQKLSGERDGLPQLRQTILAMTEEGLEDLPLLATFELNHLIARPKDKALFWQDLLLAKSVLQNL